jgi:hypothetical protein
MPQYSFGFVYALRNEGRPDLVKIGRTSGLAEDRANALFTTSVPDSFEVVFKSAASVRIFLSPSTPRFCYHRYINEWSAH